MSAVMDMISPAIFEQLFDALYDGIYFVDRERKILYWNRGAEMLTGFMRDEVLGRYCSSGILDHVDRNGCRMCEGKCPMVQALETGQSQFSRVFFRHKDQRRVAVTFQAKPIKNERDEIIGAMGILRDASAIVALEDAYNKLRELSEKDALTGVANRRQLNKTIKDQLSLLKRTGIGFSVILLEIDNYQQIIDSQGRTAGDKTLIHFAQLFQRQCRSIDIIGRFGRSRFLIILRHQKLDEAVQMAERMRIAVSASAPENFLPRGLSASFGVIEATSDDTTGSLLKRAGHALNAVRIKGGNRVESLEAVGVL